MKSENKTESDNRDSTKDIQNKRENESLLPITEEKKREILCEICNTSFKSFKSLSIHITRTHKISTRKYYDWFLKNLNDGICKKCGRSSNFYRLGSGYLNFCSIKCSRNFNKTEEKRKQTCLKIYGVDHPNKSTIIREKSKQTNLRRHGCENVFQNEKIKEKIKASIIRIYGVDNVSKCKEIIKKKEESYIKNYGVTHISLSDEYKDKYEKTMMKKYGVHHACELLSTTISKPQKEIYDTIKLKFKDAILNYYISNIRKYADVFVPSKNLIVEFYGDYWHCNPKKYKENYMNVRTHKTAKETWNDDNNRIKLLESNGFVVKIIWESDYKSGSKQIVDIL